MSGVTESGAVSMDGTSVGDQPVKHVQDLLDSIPQAWYPYPISGGMLKYLMLDGLSMGPCHCVLAVPLTQSLGNGHYTYVE